MRVTLKQVVVAGACPFALLLSGCNPKSDITTTDNTMVYDTNATSDANTMDDDSMPSAGEGGNPEATVNEMAGSNSATAPDKTTALPANHNSATPSWCPVLEDRVAVDECSAATEFAHNLGVGDAGMNVPHAMEVGEVREVSLAVLPQPSPGQPTSITMVQALGDEPATQAPIRTSRRMAALLEGNGFQIDPAGRQQRDMGLQGGTVWRWSVKALPASIHELHLSVYAVMLDQHGKSTDTLIRVLSNRVDVKTGWLVRLTEAVSDATGLTSGMSKLATAIAALIAGLGAIWAALKAFGPKGGANPKN